MPGWLIQLLVWLSFGLLRDWAKRRQQSNLSK